MLAKLLKTDFIKLISDYSIFRNNISSKTFINIIYFNDFLIFGYNKSKINNIKLWLNINNKMKNLKTCHLFLSIKVKLNKNHCIIFILQIVFINKALIIIKIQACKKINAPIIEFFNFS